MTIPTTQPTAMPALARLMERATKRPYQVVLTDHPIDGSDVVGIDAESESVCMMDGPEDDNAANAALLTLAANRLEELVTTVEKQLKHVHVLHSWVAPLEECKSSICTNARSLLAAIEAEAAAIGGAND